MLRFFRRFFYILSNRFNKKNSILSEYVSQLAIRGQGIHIQTGTRVDAHSLIESYTYIGCYCYITKSKIGRYVSIANNVSIGQGEHDLKRISTSSLFYNNAWDNLTSGECEICDDAWIGVDAVILRNVRIGIGAVVAANAVVTKNVPDYALVIGNPAKHTGWMSQHGNRLIFSNGVAKCPESGWEYVLENGKVTHKI